MGTGGDTSDTEDAEVIREYMFRTVIGHDVATFRNYVRALPDGVASPLWINDQWQGFGWTRLTQEQANEIARQPFMHHYRVRAIGELGWRWVFMDHERRGHEA